MNQTKPITIMEQPFAKSVSLTEKYKRLLETVGIEDALAILINADPDAIASALALKRIFWRRVRKISIFHINVIKRADNLSLIKLLKIDIQHIRKLDSSLFTKWAVVDSQPHHDENLVKFRFDIIVDHHPLGSQSVAPFVDIKEDYGAVSTMMTEYLRTAKIKPSPRLATALFYGIKTDTENFTRPTLPNDINAFRYLYPFTNISIIKKIESSEMTKGTLSSFHKAMDNMVFHKDMVLIHMDKVASPDILVIIADFFLKMADISWCFVSGVYGQKLIIILRTAGFRRDAGRLAVKLFGRLGSAGGHKGAARAEIQLKDLEPHVCETSGYRQFILNRVRGRWNGK